MSTPQPARSLALAFIALGGTAAVIPAIIPAMSGALDVPVGELLNAIPVLFFGLLAGVLCAPLVTARLSLGTLLVLGALSQAIGLTLVAGAPGSTWFVIGAGISGVGFGFVEAGGTAAVRVLGSNGAPRMLTKLTLFVAVSATVTPVLVLAAASLGQAKLMPATVAVAHLAAAVALRGSLRQTNDNNNTATPAPDAVAPAGALPLRDAGFLAVALFCYVGVETTISGWSAATVEQQLGTTAALAALGTSAFWLLISLGRILGTVLIDALGTGPTALLSTTSIAVSLVAAAAATALNPVPALVFLGIAVFTSGPCYALLLGISVRRISERNAVRASSSLVAVGAAGGTLIPLVSTAALPALGPTAPTMIAAIGAVVMVLAFLAARAWREPGTAAVPREIPEAVPGTPRGSAPIPKDSPNGASAGGAR